MKKITIKITAQNPNLLTTNQIINNLCKDCDTKRYILNTYKCVNSGAERGGQQVRFSRKLTETNLLAIQHLTIGSITHHFPTTSWQVLGRKKGITIFGLVTPGLSGGAYWNLYQITI